MAEDSSKNRMEEALDLFEQIVNSHYFTDIDVMLFLNKRDLFAEKIQHVDPVQWFPDYKGGKSFDAAELYFKDQFRKRVHDPKKEVYMYTTCATDTCNIQFVFDAIQSMLLQNELNDGGF
jgi:guanine nucleotide-binding protein G(i) subunit alpha